jgi:hypothetical protein
MSWVGVRPVAGGRPLATGEAFGAGVRTLSVSGAALDGLASDFKIAAALTGALVCCVTAIPTMQLALVATT